MVKMLGYLRVQRLVVIQNFGLESEAIHKISLEKIGFILRGIFGLMDI